MIRTAAPAAVLRTLLLLAALIVGTLAGASSASAMTSDRALDRYFEVRAAQTSAEISCSIDAHLVACERAVRLDRGAGLWFDRYLRLTAREWGLPSSGPGSLETWLDDPASEPDYALSEAVPSSATGSEHGPWAGTCPGGSCYGDRSAETGRPRTTYVHPYHRSDGTFVGAHYRS